MAVTRTHFTFRIDTWSANSESKTKIHRREARNQESGSLKNR